MIGTYAAAVAVCVASLALGQAAVALCGGWRWSWLSPAVGLAFLCAICWGTVRLPGDGVVSAVVVLLLVVGAIAFLWGRLEGGGEAVRTGLPVGLAALVAVSLPFAVEGHFGILGTSFNPDMSQHLLATHRLSEGVSSPLLHQGYPLGPHAVVVALDKGLGIGLVHGFSGLTMAVAVLASLTALAAFRDAAWLSRSAAALVVGLAYVVASYFAQGAFKETIEALLVLAFALALREAGRGWEGLPLRFVPAALLAVGAVFVYSFPGLLWLVGTAVVWVLVELALGRRPVDGRSLGLALLVFVVPVAPEIGRMVDFHGFETFDPNGPGLGNLFGQISPFEALGIWPSGDFRLAPGDGAVPALGYYLGAAFGLVLLGFGAWRLWSRRELAVLSGLFACLVAYAAARAGGTPYTAAKAIEIGSPLVALTILMPLVPGTAGAEGGETAAAQASPRGGWGLGTAAATLFILAAGVCSILALANAPIGPPSYSPALTGFRDEVADGSTLVLGSHELLADDHGGPYISWELRGGRVCIAAEGELDGPPKGVRYVVAEGDPKQPPFPGLEVKRVARPYVLWEVTGPVAANSPCPLIAERQARQGPDR